MSIHGSIRNYIYTNYALNKLEKAILCKETIYGYELPIAEISHFVSFLYTFVICTGEVLVLLNNSFKHHLNC